MKPYWEIPALAGIYLEDSWVLAIRATPGMLEVELEVVLREQHPNYAPPRTGEQYCYQRGRLSFASVSELYWTAQGAPAATDTSGQEDYGSIDTLEFEESRYSLIGDFGRISLVAQTPSLSWDEGPIPDALSHA
ncbi:hypothetical protein GCM10009547_48080 [Sporichthya brevicatena]|uniref:Uncharacterized protein n=1 Tax=Sporichthya brevicatena TaxID=171442 RepID=A0ABN1HCG9_9ACTN